MAETLRREAELKAAALKNTSSIKYKFLILSGKGGVGKSIVTANLALAFSRIGFKGRVSILDGDIHGPSIPTYLNIEDAQLKYDESKIYPVIGPMGIKVMSSSFFLSKKELPIIWRGPLKIKFIRDMLAMVDWSGTEVLLIDTPPGTGDEIQGVVEHTSKLSGAVVVTTPSDVSIRVVKRAINFLNVMRIPLLGIIENMSYLKCPNGDIREVFGKGSEKTEKELGGKIIARIPLNPLLSNPINEASNPYELEDLGNNEAAIAFTHAAELLLSAVRQKEGEKA